MYVLEQLEKLFKKALIGALGEQKCFEDGPWVFVDGQTGHKGKQDLSYFNPKDCKIKTVLKSVKSFVSMNVSNF